MGSIGATIAAISKTTIIVDTIFLVLLSRMFIILITSVSVLHPFGLFRCLTFHKQISLDPSAGMLHFWLNSQFAQVLLFYDILVIPASVLFVFLMLAAPVLPDNSAV